MHTSQQDQGRAGAVSYPFLVSVALPGDLICVSFSASSNTWAKASTLKSTVRCDTKILAPGQANSQLEKQTLL